MRKFTAKELAEFNGLNGKPAYVAFGGKVYDVTIGDNWEDGIHFHDDHQAGRDLTANMQDAPHDDSVLDGMPVVGEFTEE